MYGDTRHVVTSRLDLASVKSRVHFDVQPAKSISYSASALDGSSWSVEGGQEAVADSVDLSASVAFELTAHGPVVGGEHLAPLPVAQFSRFLGRAGDVDKKNSGQDPVGTGRVAGAGEKLFDLVDVGIA